MQGICEQPFTPFRFAPPLIEQQKILNDKNFHLIDQIIQICIISILAIGLPLYTDLFQLFGGGYYPIWFHERQLDRI